MFVAALQNVDVIMARHALDADTAGVYAATTVAAKFVVWVAVGIGLWTLPEATRARRGRPRPAARSCGARWASSPSSRCPLWRCSRPFRA